VPAVLDLAALGLGVPPPTVDGGEVAGALHVVDLDQDVPDPAPLLRALGRRVALVVGVARRPLSARALAVAEAIDLTLVELPGRGRAVVLVPDVDVALRLVARAVAACPRAALVTASVLRMTGLLPVADALAAEASAYSTLLAGPEHRRWLTERGVPRPDREEGDRVALGRQGDVLQVRLTRPLRRNAFDAAMRSALTDALAVALADPATSVVLSGEGPVFSAGGDLDEFGRLTDPATAWVVRRSEHPGLALHLLGGRAHVHVHGACAGAGVELPAFAARVTARRGTTVRLPELAMGLLPGAGGTVSLPRRIGRWRTAWLALTGSTLPADQALDWGLVDALDD
jgi:enoyl-CoA hydratase/carnithine racemase